MGMLYEYREYESDVNGYAIVRQSPSTVEPPSTDLTTLPQYAEGRAAAVAHPPQFETLSDGSSVGYRPLELNPYDMFTDLYYSWNAGYEDQAADLFLQLSGR